MGRAFPALLALALSSCLPAYAGSPAPTGLPPIGYFTGPVDPGAPAQNLNDLIRALNAILVPVLPAAPGAVNFLSLGSAATGSPAQLQFAPGADANAGLQINPNGAGNIALFAKAGDSGVLQFANTASFVAAPGLAACPGIPGGKAPLGMSDHLRGYIVVKDWLLRSYGMAAC